MWDRPELLTATANFLYGIAAVAAMLMAILVTVHLPVFPVREVRVVGSVEQVTRAQLEAVVRGELRGNFFTLDLEAARVSFERLPWVRRVNVRRHWPDRLEVSMEEHQVLARWGEDGLVNTHGERFEAASDRVLPVFSGPAEAAAEMARGYGDFARALDPLGRRVVQLTLSPRRAWTLRLDDGMTLELGREHAQSRLSRFAAAYAASVGRMRSAPAVVDLRYPNGFAVRIRGLRWQDGKKA